MKFSKNLVVGAMCCGFILALLPNLYGVLLCGLIILYFVYQKMISSVTEVRQQRPTRKLPAPKRDIWQENANRRQTSRHRASRSSRLTALSIQLEIVPTQALAPAVGCLLASAFYLNHEFDFFGFIMMLALISAFIDNIAPYTLRSKS